jgi:predicted TIM-barrel fold metal-dependent hydrolase
MPEPVRQPTASVGAVIDSNVHLWDQHRNPVFWLTDRTVVRNMIGNYDSLPDAYTLADYFNATASFDVRGIVWSDPGAADPVAAAAVAAQDTAGRVTWSSGSPTPPPPTSSRS